MVATSHFAGLADPGSIIIEAKHVSKKYKERTALDDVSFTVRAAEIVGILGPNGAGKSTLLRILLRQTSPDSGQVNVVGHGPQARTADIAQSVGYVPQDSMFDYRATPRTELYFQGRLFGMSRRDARNRTADLLVGVGLEAVADSQIVTLSGGNRRRLDIAMAQLHSPNLIILDEPTQGLDVESRARIWETLENLRSMGVTILFSTHDMAEAERRAKRILIIKNGRILADNTTAAIMSSHQADVLILSLDNLEKKSVLLEVARDYSNAEPWIADSHLFLPMRDAQRDGLTATEALRAKGAKINGFQIKRQSLEAAYLAIAKVKFDATFPHLRSHSE